MPKIQGSTLSNQDIHTALLIATLTAGQEYSGLMIQVMASGVAGNGNYTLYATRQLAGSGAVYQYQVPTVYAVASGATIIAFPSLLLSCSNTDVIKVYIIGLAGDVSISSIITEFWTTDGVKQDLVNAPNSTAVTAIQSGLATPTNITAGTITTVTNLTNAPSNGDFTSTMKSSITAAVPDTASIVAAVLGGVIEGSLTIQQSMRIFLAMLAGKASGGGTVSQIFRNTLDSKNRITFTTDANGNRTAVTFDLT